MRVCYSFYVVPISFGSSSGTPAKKPRFMRVVLKGRQVSPRLDRKDLDFLTDVDTVHLVRDPDLSLRLGYDTLKLTGGLRVKGIGILRLLFIHTTLFSFTFFLSFLKTLSFHNTYLLYIKYS